MITVDNGADNKDWPEPVKRAFLELCSVANRHEFSIVCAVGFNLAHARAGEIKLESFFSPRASSNPHLLEMLKDVAALFKHSVERFTQ